MYGKPERQGPNHFDRRYYHLSWQVYDASAPVFLPCCVLPVPGPNSFFYKNQTLREGERNISTQRVAHVSRFGHTKAAIDSRQV
jgi:hypothetical protein